MLRQILTHHTGGVKLGKRGRQNHFWTSVAKAAA
jgi:hypothetical protein